MLSCLYQNKPFNNNQEGYTEIQIKELGNQKELICPICNNVLFYCGKGRITSHFTHHKGTSCNEYKLKQYDNFSKEHDDLIEYIYDFLKILYPKAEIVKQKYFSELKMLTDIYLETDKIKLAIEIQLKHKNFNELINRREIYKQNGITDIWIFKEKRKMGSPYERHFYRSNNRELYYINSQTGLLTFYKGLKSEKFDTAKVPLLEYIKYSCDFDEFQIDDRDCLFLPKIKELYLEKLNEKRHIIHKKNLHKK